MLKSPIILAISILLVGCSKPTAAPIPTDYLELVALGSDLRATRNELNEGFRIARYLRYELATDSLFIMFDKGTDEYDKSRKVIYKKGILKDQSIKDDLIEALEYLSKENKRLLNPEEYEEPMIYCGYEYYVKFKFKDTSNYTIFKNTNLLDRALNGVAGLSLDLSIIRNKEIQVCGGFIQEDRMIATILSAPEFTKARVPPIKETVRYVVPEPEN